MSKSGEKKPDYLKGIKEKDSEIIQAIYRDFHKPIISLVEKNSGTKEDAHDIFQEGLVVIFEKANDPNFKLTSSFFSFFYSICKNIWYHRLRKYSGKEVTFSPSMQLTDEDNLESLKEADAQYFLYRKMFLKLGADCQKILQLFLQKVSMSEIMIKMEYGSVGYAKKRKFLCKEKLVKSIRNHPSYTELVIN